MRLPKNRLARFALYALSIVIILIAIDLLLIRLYARVHPGPDTTVLTTPTLPDDRIDYLAALDAPFAAGVTRDNNALIPFLQALGPSHALPQSVRAPVCSALGLTPAPDNPATRFLDLGEFAHAPPADKSAPVPDDEPLTRQPWRAADQPVVAAWLQRNAPYLDLLHQASLRPRYYYPYAAGRPDVLLAVLLPDINYLRTVTDAFLARAMLRAGTGGDPAGAIDDLLTVHRLAALWGQSPISINHAVASGVDITASESARGLAPRLPPPQLRALRDALDRLPPLPPVAPVIDREERFLTLDELQYLSRLNPKQAVATASTFAFPSMSNEDWPLVLRYTLPVDYDAQMRALNGFFDRLVAALNQPDYPTRRAAVDGWRASADSLPFLLRLPPFLSSQRFTMLLSPQNLLDRANVQRLLTRTAVALALSKSDTGRYPASLSELAPKYLPETPADPYTLKPFPYHPTRDGYTLYSAGPNQTDDAGQKDDLDASLPLQPPAAH